MLNKRLAAKKRKFNKDVFLKKRGHDLKGQDRAGQPAFGGSLGTSAHFSLFMQDMEVSRSNRICVGYQATTEHHISPQ